MYVEALVVSLFRNCINLRLFWCTIVDDQDSYVRLSHTYIRSIEKCVSLAFKPFYEDTSSAEGSRARATNYIAGDEKN